MLGFGGAASCGLQVGPCAFQPAGKVKGLVTEARMFPRELDAPRGRQTAYEVGQSCCSGGRSGEGGVREAVGRDACTLLLRLRGARSSFCCDRGAGGRRRQPASFVPGAVRCVWGKRNRGERRASGETQFTVSTATRPQTYTHTASKGTAASIKGEVAAHPVYHYVIYSPDYYC